MPEPSIPLAIRIPARVYDELLRFEAGVLTETDGAHGFDAVRY